jgi:hypothetical protein
MDSAAQAIEFAKRAAPQKIARKARLMKIPGIWYKITQPVISLMLLVFVS